VALLSGEPAGYIQVYDASAGSEWWPDRPGPGVVGIDQFLADGERLGQGLGTAHWGYPEAWPAEWRPQLTLTEELVASAPVFVARRGPMARARLGAARGFEREHESDRLQPPDHR
jgi:hypothetical protein